LQVIGDFVGIFGCAHGPDYSRVIQLGRCVSCVNTVNGLMALMALSGLSGLIDRGLIDRGTVAPLRAPRMDTVSSAPATPSRCGTSTVRLPTRLACLGWGSALPSP
jgi:hypothetical protein